MRHGFIPCAMALRQTEFVPFDEGTEKSRSACAMPRKTRRLQDGEHRFVGRIVWRMALSVKVFFLPARLGRRTCRTCQTF